MNISDVVNNKVGSTFNPIYSIFAADCRLGKCKNKKLKFKGIVTYSDILPSKCFLLGNRESFWNYGNRLCHLFEVDILAISYK